MRQNVSQNASWGLDGLDPDVRDAAREAARRAGMSLDEWLSVAIADRATRAYAEAPVRRRAAAAVGREAGYGPAGYEELDGAANRLGKITRGAGGAGQARVQTASRNLDQVIAQLTAEQDRRVRESAAKTAEALDSVARWIERAEDRMNESTRAVAERQDRTATVLGEALGLMTRRLDEIDRRVAEGHQPSMNAALKAVEKVEQHLAKLETRRREEADLASERDAAKQAAVDAKIEAALRGFEERIATISDRIAEAAAPRGRRGVSVRDELQEAVAEIRSRQKALDDPGAAADASPAPSRAEPASAMRGRAPMEERTRDGRTHAEILDGLRGDIAKLAGQLETVRPRANEAVPAVEAVREEISELRETVAGLATRAEVGQLEEILRSLSREASQSLLQAKLGQGGAEIAAMGSTLARLESEVRRLSDEVARNDPARLVETFETLSHKIDLVADSGVDPLVVQTLADQVVELRGLVGEIAEPVRVDGLADRVADLGRQMERLARGQIDPLEFASVRSAVEEIRGVVTARDEQAAGAEVAALAGRIDTLADKLEAVTGLLSRSDIGALSKQIEGLARAAARLDEKSTAPDLGPIATQIETLGARIDGLSAREPASVDVSPVAREIAALEKRLAEGADRLAPAALVARLDVLAEKLEDLREARSEPPLDVDGLMKRLDRIDARLESPREPPRLEALEGMIAGVAAELDRRADESGRLEPLEAMLAGLAAKLDEPSRDGSDGLEALERQIAAIAERLDRDSGSDPALAALERSMADLMTQVRGLEDGLRETVPAVAEPRGADPAFADLTRTIESLKSSQAEADRRSRETLGAVHTTLEALVARLASLEAGGVPAPRKATKAEPAAPAAAPARKPRGEPDAVALDKAGGFDLSAFRDTSRRGPSAPPPLPTTDTAAAALLAEADAPASPADEILLEPGSGRPQARQARKPLAEETDGGDIKASFIAAARRAAQSAAAEAAAAAQRDRPGLVDTGTPTSLSARIKAVVARRRKPLLLGLAAIVLAIGALQVSSMFGRGTTPVAEAPAALTAPVGATDPAPDTASATKPSQPIEAEPIEVEPSAEPEPRVDPATTESLPREGASVPSFMGLPAASLSGGIPEADLIVPARGPDGEIVPLPPRRNGATALETRVLPASAALLGDLAALGTREPAPAATDAATATSTPAPVAAIVAGIDIPANAAPATLRNAALAGDRAALFELAARLADGRDAVRDTALSAKLFERLAEDGMVPAQYRIGQIYDKGVGVTRDPAAAESWYRRAAESGNVTAMHNLAVLLAEGAVGGRPDYTGAIGWFRRAAEHGVRDSQYNLAVLLARGLGTPQDLSASYTWFAIAAAQGDTDAAARRDELAERLAAADVTLARSAADAWRPETPDPRANEVALPAHGWNDRQANLSGRVAARLG